VSENIACIVADSFGNKLFLKDLKVDNNRIYVQYRSTYNDIPFTETELFSVDEGKNCAILSDNGTVLYRFSVKWLDKLK
jgi:hypothetical protein